MSNEETSTAVAEKNESFAMANEYFELKTKIHGKLLDLIDLSMIDALEEDALRSEIRRLVQGILLEDPWTEGFQVPNKGIRDTAVRKGGFQPVQDTIGCEVPER